jgi:hypothetical protein
MTTEDEKVQEPVLQAQVTRKRAIELQCHECMGFYFDGVQDCECVRCSLYPFMPYRKMEPDLTAYQYNPRRKGKVPLSAPDPERSERARERFHGGKTSEADDELGDSSEEEAE